MSKSPFHKFEIGSRHWYFYRPHYWEADRPGLWTPVVITKLIMAKHEGRYTEEVKAGMPDYVIESLIHPAFAVSAREVSLCTHAEMKLAKALKGQA